MHEFNPIFPVNFEQALNSLIYGERILKLGNFGDPHVRKFFIDPEIMQRLQWITPAKEVKKSSINVHTVTSISFGFKTATFNKHKQQFQNKEHLAVSVRYLIKGQTKRSLNLIFDSVEKMRLFATGLQYIILKETRGLVLSTSEQFDKRYLSNIWTKYQGQEVDLEPETVRQIIQHLNIGVYPHYFDRQAQNLAGPVSDKLNHSDFLAIVSVLSEHGELKEVFEKYRESEGEEFDIAAALNPTISISGLSKFFKEEQKEHYSLAEIRDVVQVASSFLYSEHGDWRQLGQFEDNKNAVHALSRRRYKKARKQSETRVLQLHISTEAPSKLGLMGFSNIVFSKTNVVVDSSFQFRTAMNYPLSCYFVNTACYAYLKINPKTKRLEVTEEKYRVYLLKGVRCVDIELIVFVCINPRTAPLSCQKSATDQSLNKLYRWKRC